MNLNRFALWRYSRVNALIMAALFVAAVIGFVVTGDAVHFGNALIIAVVVSLEVELQLAREQAAEFRSALNDIAATHTEKESK